MYSIPTPMRRRQDERLNRFDDIAERFPGAGTLVKGIQIIEILDQIGRPATSAELLAQTGLPKATLYRLIGALTAFGYIRHDPRLKTYALGHRLIELAGKSMASFDLRTAAETEVLRLSKELNETVSLAVLEGERTIYVDVRRPSNPLAIGVEIGRELPALESASGHAILSAQPPHRVNGIIGALPAEEQSALLADFAIARARGYSIANSRTLEGVVVIAVPVNGPPGMGHGAIVVTALASRLSYERRHVIRAPGHGQYRERPCEHHRQSAPHRPCRGRARMPRRDRGHRRRRPGLGRPRRGVALGRCRRARLSRLRSQTRRKPHVAGALHRVGSSAGRGRRYAGAHPERARTL